QTLALLQSSLAPWGFQVTTFTSACDLWHWLSMGAQSPADIVVLDIKMPSVNGFEVCRVIRADSRFQAMPILFLTNHLDDALRVRAFQAGADDFVDKSVAPAELATRLRNQLSRACRIPILL
ncbi:MAG: response regulator transcription factor, partial [Cyanobacteria bacterium J06649_4]